ncbi:ROK family protein [Paenibacillus gansuensis]|uniref:ROK family protein n=1 Tax=Paenibacillus gansuensis TaxID=306542 RepID=A0ABW5PIV9_9BACL
MNVIGIDIGGTTVKGAVCTSEGYVLRETAVRTQAQEGKARILAGMSAVVEDLVSAHPDAAAIGIGSAGRIDPETGIVVYATDNLPGWQGTNLSEWGKQSFGLPAFADNDANTALLGEIWQGAVQGEQDAVMLTLGTGVGGANFIGGRMVCGAHCSGGDWGHVILYPDGRPCNCGKRGCAEQYVSGTGLVRLASEACGTVFENGQQVFAAAEAGMKAAVETVEQFARNLALITLNVMHSLDPQAIVIGGGVVDAKEAWWGRYRKAVASMSAPAIEPQIVPALLGNTAGYIGAAKLALDRMEEETQRWNKNKRTS